MALAAGTRLGPYEIVAPLGAGGMGEVYRAQDLRLGREVAVKVLPAEVASDPERLRRFEQEAKAASALNHPNILTVHDFAAEGSTAFLVTELLVGESLRELLQRGAVNVKRTVEVATQIAKGLAAAHDQGIVHRDLKPENLFLTKDGTAKILDFGLARIDRPELSSADLQQVSTMLETSAGTVLGTVGYMAPEQVRGERADSRSDLFSLGVVLHELLAGANPFHRDSVIESLNAILKEEPPELAATPSGSSPAFGRLVARLLEKDPDRRFRSAHDLVFALEGLGEAASGERGPHAAPTAPTGLAPRRWLPVVVAAAALVAGLGAGLWLRGNASAVHPGRISFQIQPPEAGGFPSHAETHNLALSPDGRTLAYVVSQHGASLLHARDLENIDSRPLPDTEGARSPFWSPDGKTIAFFAAGKLKRVAREGGPVQVICDTQGSNTGAWGSRGTIVFSQGFGPDNGLYRIAAAGGTPTKIPSFGDLPRWMDFLPDGRRFLYWDRSTDSVSGKVYLGDLESDESKLLLDVSSLARYAAPGWLLYDRSNTLVAQRFDADSAELSGEPIPLASNLPYFFNGWAVFSVAGTNALAYQVKPPSPPLIWLDRHGRELGRVGPPGHYLAVRLAPNDRSAVVTLSDPATAYTDLWVVDLERGGITRLTDEPFLEWSPVWSPDGGQIAYTATSPGPKFTLTVRRVGDGAKIASLPPHFSFFWPRGWSRNGIVIDRNEPKTSTDLWRWPALDAEPVPILQTEFDEQLASPSPDGSWVAFYTGASGRGEIELFRLDTPGRRIRVSNGAQSVVPRWRADGRELFYVSTEGWLTAMPIDARESAALGEAEALFAVDFANNDAFDVTADGQRFLIAASRPSSSLPITVVLDWQAALARD